MIGGTLAKNILDALVNQNHATGKWDSSTSAGSNNKNLEISFRTAEARLALFQTLPDKTGTGAVEISLSGYGRKILAGNGLAGAKQFGTPATWHAAEESGDTEDYYYIENTDDIQMHAIDETETQTQNVKGFGIYVKNASGADVLVAWGDVLDNSGQVVSAGIPLSAGAVPIFYKGQFKLMLG